MPTKPSTNPDTTMKAAAIAGLDDDHRDGLVGAGPRAWLACQFPERPDDLSTIWVWTCTACMIHLAVAAARGDGLPAFNSDTDKGTRDPMTTLAACLEEAMEWRGQNGYPVLPHRAVPASSTDT